MSNFEVISCSTAEEYLRVLDLAGGIWLDQQQRCDWVFRGHSNVEHLLISPLHRKIDGEYQYNSQFKKIILEGVPELEAVIKNSIDSRLEKNDVNKDRLFEIIKAAFAEVDSTDRFLLECNNKGLNIPSLTLFNTQDVSISATQYFYNFLGEKSQVL